MNEPAQRIGPADALTARLEPMHLRQRLGIESEGEAPVFGRGRTYFHPENALSLRRLLQFALRLSGLYRRGQRNARDIGVVRHRLPIRNLPAALVGLQLLHITDLHLDVHPDFPRLLAERVRALDYDVCVLTGDYRYRTCGPLAPALAGLDYLRRHLREPVYAVLGNHDSIRMVPSMEEMGIRVLLNEWERLERGDHSLYFVGVDDPHFFRADNLERACSGVPEQAPSILLCHSPELFRQAAHSGFDAMLCGHTHGGQIRLPGGIALLTNAECPRNFTAGAWRYRTLYGYTSVGAGSSIVDVRFNCRPEVVLHRLDRAAASQ